VSCRVSTSPPSTCPLRVRNSAPSRLLSHPRCATSWLLLLTATAAATATQACGDISKQPSAIIDNCNKRIKYSIKAWPSRSSSVSRSDTLLHSPSPHSPPPPPPPPPLAHSRESRHCINDEGREGERGPVPPCHHDIHHPHPHQAGGGATAAAHLCRAVRQQHEPFHGRPLQASVGGAGSLWMASTLPGHRRRASVSLIVSPSSPHPHPHPHPQASGIPHLLVRHGPNCSASRALDQRAQRVQFRGTFVRGNVPGAQGQGSATVWGGGASVSCTQPCAIWQYGHMSPTPPLANP
jgi:hypothetical protein